MIVYAFLLGAAVLAPQSTPAAAPPQQPAAATAPAPAKNLNFEVFRTQVEPILLKKRPGNVACVTCHGGGASSQLRLQPLAEGAFEWTEEQSRRNMEAIARLVVTNEPMKSR